MDDGRWTMDDGRWTMDELILLIIEYLIQKIRNKEMNLKYFDSASLSRIFSISLQKPI